MPLPLPRSLALILLGVTGVADPGHAASQRPWATWVQAYLADFHARHPGQASLDGNHAQDSHLARFSPRARREEAAALQRFAASLRRLGPPTPASPEALERRLAADSLAARQEGLTEVREWARNPLTYTDELTNALLTPALYPTAPAEVRLRAVVAREGELPRLLEEARANLTEVPAPLARAGLEAVRGLEGFVGRDLPEAFTGVGSPGLQARFRARTREAHRALVAFGDWLERTVLPTAPAAFALGPERLRALLRHREGVPTPLAELLARGEAELTRNEARFQALAQRVAPGRSPEEAWAEVRRDVPRPDALLSEARTQVEALKAFLAEKRLVPMPRHAPLEVAPTPPFMPGTFAAEYNVGPFEPVEAPARYYLTLPAPSWTPQQVAEHLSEFSRPALWITTAHEGYPGHYLQGVHLRNQRNPLRTSGLFSSTAYVEGWAHYAEQLVVEEGFLESDPRIALAQAKDALLRTCRYLMALRMHAEGWTVEAATSFFVQHAHMAEGPARMEAERATYDPLTLAYTLGKLEILRLREDLRAREGSTFSLARFHERLLAQGQVPFWFHRAELLGEPLP